MGAEARSTAGWRPSSVCWLLAWRQWQQHAWRHGMALLAVALGVALASSVHFINSSALSEFSQAVRTANGQPDLTLRSPRLPDHWFEKAALAPEVSAASPVLEIDTLAKTGDGRRVPVKVLGVDALLLANLAPQLMPLPAKGQDRLAFLDPDVVFVNGAAQRPLALAGAGSGVSPEFVSLQQGSQYLQLRVAGTVPADGQALVVMDLAGAQHHFDRVDTLSRIDLRLAPGVDKTALLQQWALPRAITAVAPGDAEQRISNLSRAYRVNLTVLALVALCVGAFLVFSVVSLSVAQRTPALALLGVLGMSARQRRNDVLAECAAVGLLGGILGVAAGAGLAQAALHFMGGDLGGGYFPGVAPKLQWRWPSAAVFVALGVVAAVAGGLWPALQTARLAPAQALKGLGSDQAATAPAWPGLALLALGAAAAVLPPIGGLPLAAYVAVAALLFGGVTLVPVAVRLLLARVPAPRGALLLLALQRARFARAGATAAMAGVVSSLALSVALTVMVSSFRSGVAQWLDSVLPADLYARTSGSASASDQAWLPPEFASQARQLEGVQRVQVSRTRSLPLAPDKPQVALIARPLDSPDQALPMVQPALPRTSLQRGETALYVSEAVVSLYGATVGSLLVLPLGEFEVRGRVLGVWRDYARQFGSIAMADTDYAQLTGDTRINDLALWLEPGTPLSQVQAALRAILPDPGMLDFASTAELRAISLRIFDRSFAVTQYLQALAILIGLVGVAASLSAQVLARRKEFGLLVHLGLTRRQVLQVVVGEAAAWVAAGVAVGLLLGLAISVVLVKVVNPQSFHWTMDLVLPWPSLLALCAGVGVAGTLTAALSARSASAAHAVSSVRQDW